MTEEKFQSKKLYSTKKYLENYEMIYPEMAEKYFNLNLIKNRRFDYEKDIKNYEITTKKQKNKKPITKINKEKTTVNSMMKTLMPMLNKISHSTNTTNNITISEINNRIKENSKNKKPHVKNLIFNMKNLKMIIEEKPKTIFINCRNDELQEDEKVLFQFLSLYLRNDINLYVFNTNVKTFDMTRVFIEKNTSFNFSQVAMTNIIYFNQKFTNYCSRYVLSEEMNRVFRKSEYDKNELIKIIANMGNKDDEIVIFFDNSLFYKDIKKKHHCLIKKGQIKNATVLKLMNKAIEETMEKENQKQLSLFENKEDKQNIG